MEIRENQEEILLSFIVNISRESLVKIQFCIKFYREKTLDSLMENLLSSLQTILSIFPSRDMSPFTIN